MGIFDNIAGFFNGDTAKDAAGKQIAGLNAGYGQASDLLGQGRGALTTNFTAGLQPFLQNYATAQGGQNAYADATGANGADGSARARANFQADPGYQYRLTQGNENVLRNASRTGQGNSGAVNLDLQKQGQGLADQGWQQYVSNLQPFLGGANSAAGGIGSLYSGLGTGLNASYGTQGNAAYGTQAGIGNAQSSAELAKNSGVGNLINLGMGIAGLGSNSLGAGAASGAGSAIMGLFSDERLKEDIEPVGELFDGQPIYRYRYIDDPIMRIGLMAQDVEEIHPEAVGEVGGFKMVDYGKATDFASKLREFI